MMGLQPRLGRVSAGAPREGADGGGGSPPWAAELRRGPGISPGCRSAAAVRGKPGRRPQLRATGPVCVDKGAPSAGVPSLPSSLGQILLLLQRHPQSLPESKAVEPAAGVQSSFPGVGGCGGVVSPQGPVFLFSPPTSGCPPPRELCAWSMPCGCGQGPTGRLRGGWGGQALAGSLGA